MAEGSSAAGNARFGATLRRDAWWIEIAPVMLVLGAFAVYATIRAFDQLTTEDPTGDVAMATAKNQKFLSATSIGLMTAAAVVTSLRGFLEQRGGDFSASFSGKLKMFLQCVAATAAILSMHPPLATWSVGGVSFTCVRDVLLWTMVAVTVWSGWDYVQRAIQILRGLGTKA